MCPPQSACFASKAADKTLADFVCLRNARGGEPTDSSHRQRQPRNHQREIRSAPSHPRPCSRRSQHPSTGYRSRGGRAFWSSCRFSGCRSSMSVTLKPADFRVPRAVSGTCCYRTVLRCRAGAAGAAARQLGGCRVIIATGTVNFVPSCAVISPIGFLRRFIPGFWLAE